eukprot:1148582-Rhodomonas_salina.2
MSTTAWTRSETAASNWVLILYMSASGEPAISTAGATYQAVRRKSRRAESWGWWGDRIVLSTGLAQIMHVLCSFSHVVQQVSQAVCLNTD